MTLEQLRSEVEARGLSESGREARVAAFAAVTEAVKAGACELEALEAVAPFVAPNDLAHMAYQLGRAEGVREGRLLGDERGGVAA